MALKTTSEMLEEVETAISLTLKAQSSSMGDKAHFMPKLDTLFAQRDRLRMQLAKEQGTGGISFNSGLVKR